MAQKRGHTCEFYLQMQPLLVIFYIQLFLSFLRYPAIYILYESIAFCILFLFPILCLTFQTLFPF